MQVSKIALSLMFIVALVCLFSDRWTNSSGVSEIPIKEAISDPFVDTESDSENIVIVQKAKLERELLNGNSKAHVSNSVVAKPGKLVAGELGGFVDPEDISTYPVKHFPPRNIGEPVSVEDYQKGLFTHYNAKVGEIGEFIAVESYGKNVPDKGYRVDIGEPLDADLYYARSSNNEPVNIGEYIDPETYLEKNN